VREILGFDLGLGKFFEVLVLKKPRLHLCCVWNISLRYLVSEKSTRMLPCGVDCVR